MANASLAALYRPQTFAQVVGQDMVKSILSRAAQEDRVAPAYLLSGTRGVGKTTIARIFAKALNCVHAPAAEPCNECEACRRITQGGFVDVVEIDGASNRGIDDVRRLRDAVGYAPLEGRYKVFIIDEAHMLTKEAFNALLKTLEEPPPRVTFILATTEQHKFPVTIVSRCQHFVFRQIPEATLEAHIVSVLEREGRAFEPEAARLIARRAAGSVRDAMSLLGQVLALGAAGPGGTEPLTAAQTRDVLGLAGQEVMERLLGVLAAHDAAGVTALVRELLLQGVDMGFFLRELGSLWRTLFLLHQAGQAVSADLSLPEADVRRLADMAGRFSLTYIHAAWQMTLDGQRRILTSLEPAAGLELLLLNLALLPRLLPLAELSPSGVMPAGSAAGPAPGAQTSPAGMRGGSFPSSPASGKSAETAPPRPAERANQAPAMTAPLRRDDSSAVPPSGGFAGRPGSPSVEAARDPGGVPAYLLDDNAPLPEPDGPPADAATFLDMPGADAGPETAPGEDGPGLKTMPAPGKGTSRAASGAASGRKSAAPRAGGAAASRPASADLADLERTPVDPALPWADFLAFCKERDEVPAPLLHQFAGVVRGDTLVLRTSSQVMFNQIQRPPLAAALQKAAADWAGRPLKALFLPPSREHKTEAEWRAEMLEHPVVQTLGALYDATLLRCAPVDENR
ncbi:MAG: DNA polymerase III subunit gamma/tau [Desulfovibrionaceae bacterium]|nr:DNA polymerase III subunit gamma/tau [Desulfovibrionaceae bacterium]